MKNHILIFVLLISLCAKVAAQNMNEKITEYVQSILPERGNIVQEQRDGRFGETVWTLSNGMKVVHKKTLFVGGRIYVSAIGPGGKSLFEDDDMLDANYAEDVKFIGGLGIFSWDSLHSMSLLSEEIGVETQRMFGDISKQRIKRLFEAMYLSFTSIREDREAFAGFKSRRCGLETYRQEDKIKYPYSLRYHDPSYISEADTARINYDRMLYIYRTCFANPGSFVVSVTGDFDEDELRDCVEVYLAGLPSGNKDIKAIPRPSGLRKGKHTEKLGRYTSSNDAAYAYIYSANIKQDQSIGYQFEIFERIIFQQGFSLLFSTPNNDDGVSLSVSLKSNNMRDEECLLQIILPTTFSMGMGKVKSEEAYALHEKRNARLLRELERLKNEGPSQNEFDNAVNYLLDEFNYNHGKESRMRYSDSRDEYWRTALENFYYYGIDVDTNYEKQIKAVTRKEIHKLMKKILTSDNYLEIIWKPEM